MKSLRQEKITNNLRVWLSIVAGGLLATIVVIPKMIELFVSEDWLRISQPQRQSAQIAASVIFLLGGIGLLLLGMREHFQKTHRLLSMLLTGVGIALLLTGIFFFLSRLA